MARSERERALIQRWLADYNRSCGTAFEIADWPDEDSTVQAVDATASDPNYGDFAVEHTLLQPFAGERQDSVIFARTVGRLNQNPNLLFPGFDVTLCFKVGAIPKGLDWNCVAPAVEAWYQSSFEQLSVGSSRHNIAGVPFHLSVDVDKEPTTNAPHLFIDRWMPKETLEAVVRTVLTTKLPKLVAAQAMKRILLLEKNSLPRGYGEVGETIEALRTDFPRLERIDQVWVVNTVAWETRDYVSFYLVWPREAALAWSHKRRSGV